ncbi:MAG: hypothetical protein C5B53_00955, partial [Candidatus Melainabacteria bacterium]
MRPTVKKCRLLLTACYLTTASTIGLLPGSFNGALLVGASASQQEWRWKELEAIQKAIQDAEQSDPNGLALIECLENEAKLYANQYDWANAEKAYRRVVSIRERFAIANYSLMADTYGQMSEYLLSLGKFDEAEKYARLAFANRQKETGFSKVNLLGELERMAGFYARTNQPDKAIPYYKEMVDIDQSNRMGSDAAAHLGVYCMNLGRYSEAEPFLKLYVAQLDDRYGAHGKDFSNYEPIPFVLMLAKVATLQRHFDEAKPYFERVKGYYDHQKHTYCGDRYPEDVLQAYTQYLLNS